MPLTSEQWKKGNKLKKGIHGINPFKVHGLSISKIYETSPFFYSYSIDSKIFKVRKCH